MTFKEIEKIKRLLSTIDSIDDFRKMQELESEVTAFFGDKFNVRLKITTLNTKEFYTKEHENTDKIAVRSFLESLIAQDINAPEIINILDLIEEGECSKNDKTLQSLNFILQSK